MRPMGGVLGGMSAFGGATEHQGNGTPHFHCEGHIVCCYQYGTLADIAEKIKAGVLSAAAVKEYQDWQKAVGIKVRTTKSTLAVRTLLSVKKTGKDTNSKVTEMQPMVAELHAHMQGELDNQLELAGARKQRNEAFASRVEAGGGITLEQNQLQIKILQEEVKMIKANESWTHVWHLLQDRSQDGRMQVQFC